MNKILNNINHQFVSFLGSIKEKISNSRICKIVESTLEVLRNLFSKPAEAKIEITAAPENTIITIAAVEDTGYFSSLPIAKESSPEFCQYDRGWLNELGLQN